MNRQVAMSLGILVLMVLGSHPTVGQAQTTAEMLLEAQALSDEQLTALLAGDVVSSGVAPLEASKAQLAASAVAWTAVPFERAARLVDAEDPRQVVRTWAIDDADDVTAVELSAEDLTKLRTKAHRAFNLSAAESASLRATESQEQTLAAFRLLLAERVRSYQAEGLAGIESYRRGKRKSVNPAEELRQANAAILSDRTTTPALAELLREIDEGLPSGSDGSEHRLQLVEKVVQDRPHHALSHLALLRGEDGLVIVERQFYSSHSYDALQVVVGLFPYREGSLVAVFGQTATDQVAGIGSNLAHSIGRGRSADSYASLATLVRSAIEALP